MPQRSLKIGLFGHAVQECVGRPFGGTLKFVRDHPHVTLLDFCLTAQYEWTEEVPPWIGQVDGMLLSTGYDDPENLLQWYSRGGVPVVSVSGVTPPNQELTLFYRRTIELPSFGGQFMRLLCEVGANPMNEAIGKLKNVQPESSRSRKSVA